jgi:hypothetical protein
MKRQVIITIILLIATAYVTVVYFKNLNPPGLRTNQVMHDIPGNAAMVFEFNNDKGFYDIFNNNKLLEAVTGRQKLGELDTLRRQLLQNSLISSYFKEQNIFVSVHPSKSGSAELLFTLSSVNNFEPSIINRLIKQPNSGLQISAIRINGKQGYSIYIAALKKAFYVINKDGHIFSGSFSKELIELAAAYTYKKSEPAFVLLSDQQSNNSLANLYVNYEGLTPLFDLYFQNKNTDIFRSFRLLPGLAGLSLNYRSDALMFNGTTTIKQNEAAGYLNLFINQKPFTNHLKDILPSTTAYSTNFAISDPLKFGTDLNEWYNKAGFKDEKDKLFKKIKAETGISLKSEFNNLLSNEFAIATTRYFEKFAIVSVKDGSKLKLILSAISTMTDENNGQLSYEKVPFFLLGDAFTIFRKPYFKIIDNYLIMANSPAEIISFNDTYLNRKFLNKNDQYNQFNDLLAGQNNVAFFLNFKNSQPIFERDMNRDAYNDFKNTEPGWKSFYGASFQLSAVDKDFYTNICLKLNSDTTVSKLK